MEGGQHLGTGLKKKTKPTFFSSCSLTEHHSKADRKRNKTPTLPEDTSCQHVNDMEGSEGLEERSQNLKISASKKFYLRRAVKLSVLNHLHFLELGRQKDLGRTRSCHASSPSQSTSTSLSRQQQQGHPLQHLIGSQQRQAISAGLPWAWRRVYRPSPWQPWHRGKVPAKMTEANSKSLRVLSLP